MDVGKLDNYVGYDNDDLVLPKTLPNMNGSWYLLIYPIAIKPEFQTKSGFTLLLPDDTSDAHQNLISAGVVVKKGSLAYKHAKFKDPETGMYQPWCDVGDYVVFSRGSMAYTVVHEGKRFYVMPDDAIMYTVDDLRHIDPKYSYDPSQLERIQLEIKELNSTKGQPNG